MAASLLMTPPAPNRSARTCALLLAAVLLTAAGCSVERNYHTLSLFFDGVPNPADKPLVYQGPDPPEVDWNALTPEERTAQVKFKVPEQKVTFHKPYADRSCTECHQFEQSPEANSWMVGLPTLIQPIEQLCGTCHGPPHTAFVHGPVGASRCDLCHAHHQSRYPHLLKTENADELCVRCHSGSAFQTAGEHAGFTESSCTACHDPHGGPEEHLLKPEWVALAYSQGPKPLAEEPE